MAGDPLPFEQLVFSGGGIRRFWRDSRLTDRGCKLPRNMAEAFANEDANVTYIPPSQHVLDGKIDFTDPEKLRESWALGEEDGRAYLSEARATSTQKEE